MNQPGDRPPRLLLIAGESSGDALGAALVHALRERHLHLEVRGMGGRALANAGMSCIFSADELAVVGLVEVALKGAIIARALRRLKRELRSWRPDLVLLIDFPTFNLHMARFARRMGIPTIFYVGPQLWAWRRRRIVSIKKFVDHVMVLFPFEVPFYEAAGVPVTYVGHPVLDRIDRLPPALRESRAPTVALLPGSRSGEVTALLPTLLTAAAALHRLRPDVRFVVAQADGLGAMNFRDYVKFSLPPIDIVRGRTLEVLRDSDMAIIASGTATLEAALLQVPMVVVYRTSWLTYAVARLLVRGISWIGLVNLVAGFQVVPERIQWLAPEALAELLVEYLDNGVLRSDTRAALLATRRRLGRPGGAHRAAEVVSAFLFNTTGHAARTADQ